MSKFKHDDIPTELETYSHTEHCRNCGHANFLSIPKGTTVTSYLFDQKCSNCGVHLKSTPEPRPRDVWL